MSSVQYAGTDTDTETQAIIKLLLKKIEALTDRVEFAERISRSMEDEQRQIRREAMHTENVLATIWRRVMGPLPTTPDPMPTTPDPIPPAPILDPAPRPRPPVPQPPVAPAPEPMPTPPAPPKPPTEAKNRVSEAFNSLRGHFGW